MVSALAVGTLYKEEPAQDYRSEGTTILNHSSGQRLSLFRVSRPKLIRALAHVRVVLDHAPAVFHEGQHVRSREGAAAKLEFGFQGQGEVVAVHGACPRRCWRINSPDAWPTKRSSTLTNGILFWWISCSPRRIG